MSQPTGEARKSGFEDVDKRRAVKSTTVPKKKARYGPTGRRLDAPRPPRRPVPVHPTQVPLPDEDDDELLMAEYGDMPMMDPTGSRKQYKRKYRRGDIKSVDTSIVTAAKMSATPTGNADIFCVTLVAEGTADYQRVGRYIYPKAIQLAGVIGFVTEPDSSNQNWPETVRMCLVWDKSPDGVIPSFETMFQQIDAAGSTAGSDIFDKINPREKSRFKILRNWTVSAAPPGNSLADQGGILQKTTTRQHIAFDTYVPLTKKGLEIQFNASTASIASVVSGAAYIVWRATNLGGGLVNYANVHSAHARFTYSDKQPSDN